MFWLTIDLEEMQSEGLRLYVLLDYQFSEVDPPLIFPANLMLFLRQADWFDGLQIFPIAMHGSQILWTIDKLLSSCNTNFQY